MTDAYKNGISQRHGHDESKKDEGDFGPVSDTKAAQAHTSDDKLWQTPGEVATIDGSLPGAWLPAWGYHGKDHQRYGHVVHTNPSKAQVNEHVAKVHLLPGLGKSLSPLFAACSTVSPTGLTWRQNDPKQRG